MKLTLKLYNTIGQKYQFNNYDGTLNIKNQMQKTSTAMWQTQAINFTTTEIFNVDLSLPEVSAKKMTWIFHVGEYTEVRCGIILGIYILNPLININPKKYNSRGCNIIQMVQVTYG